MNLKHPLVVIQSEDRQALIDAIAAAVAIAIVAEKEPVDPRIQAQAWLNVVYYADAIGMKYFTEPYLTLVAAVDDAETIGANKRDVQ